MLVLDECNYDTVKNFVDAFINNEAYIIAESQLLFVSINNGR